MNITSRLNEFLIGMLAICSFALFFDGTMSVCVAAETASYALTVYPAEHKVMTDPETGAELCFLTTAPADDTNLYFHERSWLADGSAIIFNSSRENGGLMAYLAATGELVRLASEDGSIGGATAAVGRNSVFGLRGNDVLEMALTVEISEEPGTHPSRVVAIERRICTLSGMTPSTSLNESCDGKYLSLGVKCAGDLPAIVTINVKRGKVKELCRFDNATQSTQAGGVTRPTVSHVQWSRTNPRLLSFAGVPDRLWVVDIRDGKPWCPYRQWPDELVTHESWWVDDQILFCGGLHPKPTEDSHVKILDPKTGVVRIIGPGSWWPESTPFEISRRNWWHAAGIENGRWVAADNWHGDIMLFEGRTGRNRLLTTNHRTYGSGAHPHVGWDRVGRQVVFTSHKLGNPDVCVATIPAEWQEDVQESQ